MTSRRNFSQMYADVGYGVSDSLDDNLPTRYKRGRRKSITVTRKDSKPSIAPMSPAPASPRPRPMKRSDSSLSRVSLASEFATIQEDSVCDDFRGENSQSFSSSMSDSRRGSLQSSVSLSLVDRRRLSSSSLSNDYSSSYDQPRRVSFNDRRSSSYFSDDYSKSLSRQNSPIERRLSNDFSPSPSHGAPPRRVSVVSLRRDSGTSMVDFNARRLSTVSDAVVVRKRSKSKRRGTLDGRNRRASAGDAPGMSSALRSFPPRTSSGYRASHPAYRSYPPPEMDNVVFDDEDDEISMTMADRDDLSYEASLRRASLASIHEMHHAVELLKNQRALDKAERNVSPALSSSRRHSKARGGRRSSLTTPGDSPRQSVISTSSNRTVIDADSRRSSVSASIQDMHQTVALIQEKRLVKKLNAKVQFSVVEDAIRPSDRRRVSASAGGRRRGSAGGSSVSAVSYNSMSGSLSGSEDSDSNSSSSDYSSSSSSSTSGSSSSDGSNSSASSSLDSSSDSDSANSDSEGSLSDHESNASDGSDQDNDSHHSGVSSGSSSETDSGNGTLSSSHGSKTDGLPKSPHDIPGPSGVHRQAAQYSPKPTPEPLHNIQENYFDFEVDNNQKPEDGHDKSQRAVNSQTKSSVCVIL